MNGAWPTELDGDPEGVSVGVSEGVSPGVSEGVPPVCGAPGGTGCHERQHRTPPETMGCRPDPSGLTPYRTSPATKAIVDPSGDHAIDPSPVHPGDRQLSGPEHGRTGCRFDPSVQTVHSSPSSLTTRMNA